MTAIGVLPDLSSSFEKGNPAYSQEPTCLDFLLFLTDGMQTVLFIFSFFLGFPKLRVELVGKVASEGTKIRVALYRKDQPTKGKRVLVFRAHAFSAHVAPLSDPGSCVAQC